MSAADTCAAVISVNLSGGQKQRVNLARAVYSEHSLVLLDDVLSAVDSHVGAHIVRHCLGGPLLLGRTVVMATHALQFLTHPCITRIIALDDSGAIQADGDFTHVSEILGWTPDPTIPSAAPDSDVSTAPALVYRGSIRAQEEEEEEHTTQHSREDLQVSGAPEPASTAQQIATETQEQGGISSGVIIGYYRQHVAPIHSRGWIILTHCSACPMQGVWMLGAALRAGDEFGVSGVEYTLPVLAQPLVHRRSTPHLAVRAGLRYVCVCACMGVFLHVQAYVFGELPLGVLDIGGVRRCIQCASGGDVHRASGVLHRRLPHSGQRTSQPNATRRAVVTGVFLRHYSHWANREPVYGTYAHPN